MTTFSDPAKDNVEERVEEKIEGQKLEDSDKDTEQNADDDGFGFRPRIRTYPARKFGVVDKVYVTSGARGLQGPYLVSSLHQGGYILSTLDSTAYVENRRVFRENELDFAP